MATEEGYIAQIVGDAVIGIDTLWGGDVTCPSGAGRFIADSWFSDLPLPRSYTHETAARLRAIGGVAAPAPDREAIDDYLSEVDVSGAIAALAEIAREKGGLRGAYFDGLIICFAVMWDLAMERLGRGEPVSYERCVRAATGRDPEPSAPAETREKVTQLLARAGYAPAAVDERLSAVDAWRRDRLVPPPAIRSLSSAFIAQLEALTAANVVTRLPEELSRVPRANVRFMPVKDAWFSGSMNYLGRARRPDGSPEFEATYEINASLQISVTEFQQLISHEIVPGHVMTFACLQSLFTRGYLGFESSIPAMNTRGSTLHEGLANNALLMAYDVLDIGQLPDDDLKIGMLLAELQDEAKNQASYLTWKEERPQNEVAEILRREYLCTPERADKLSGAWGRHPLLGRMSLPAYRIGTRAVAALRMKHPPEVLLPILYGCRGLVDVVTIERAIDAAL
ncbi:MAG: hypothetical protein JXO72_05170 [Vicinamibacteria bacterium]|nr:hypothetical protein [Vicinamibacteria bacterium]